MSKNLLHWHSYMLFQKKPLATNTTSDTKKEKFWGVLLYTPTEKC